MLSEITAFLINHWALTLGLVAFFLAFMLNESRMAAMGSDALSPQEAIQLVSHKGAIFVDLRDQLSFNTHHILGSIHCPEARDLSKIKRNQILILVGAADQIDVKQKTACQAVSEKIYYLKGGILAWQQENLPLVKTNNIQLIKCNINKN